MHDDESNIRNQQVAILVFKCFASKCFKRTPKYSFGFNLLFKAINFLLIFLLILFYAQNTCSSSNNINKQHVAKWSSLFHVLWSTCWATFHLLTNHDPFIDIYPWGFTLANLRRKGFFRCLLWHGFNLHR
jgi:hypothetical protein